MNEIFDRFKQFPFWREAVFMFGLLLILGAWKFGIEGISE